MKARLLAGAFVLYAVLAAPLAAAAITPRGDVFRIDEAPDCLEREPDAASFAHGGFVSVWTGSARPGQAGAARVFARVFDAAGAPAGPEIEVEPGAGPAADAADAARAVVAATSVNFGDRFLVVWHDGGRDLVASRLFNATTGVPLGEENVILPDIETEEVGLDVTALPDGTFAVAVSQLVDVSLRLLEVDGEPSSPLITVATADFVFFPSGITPFLFDPAIAAQPDGDLVLAWHLRSGEPFPTSAVDGMLIPAGTAAQRHLWRFLQWGETGEGLTGWKTGMALGTDAAGNTVAVWRVAESEDEPSFTFGVQRFDPDGRGIGNAFQTPSVTGRTWEELGVPALLVNPNGSFLLAWHGMLGDQAPLPAFSSIYAQAFSAAGAPEGGFFVVAAPDPGSREEAALVRGADGGAFVLWQEGRVGQHPSLCFSSGISARGLFAGCQPGPNRLCLGEGRFQLETTWVAPGFGSGSGPGKAVQLTRDTGHFWFFDAENVELMVKVLDGRALNGKFWVFYGSLSNVAWRLRVTDLVTGAVKNYDNPRNQLASRGDTDALPGSVSAVSAGAEGIEVRPFEVLSLDGLAPRAAPSHTPGEQFSGPCSLFPVTTPPPTRPGLCLNDERFEVEVTWHDPFNGGQGIGQGVGLTGDSGYFWFFNPANVELVVKVLDARTVNGKFWVFYGALTNVEYDIRVRDVESGAERTYHNPPFQFLSRADTAAFPLP